MEFMVLCSGSKGNSTVIRCGNTHLMIDCGSTKNYLVEQLNNYDLSINSIDVLLLTHNHSDHISQLKLFSAIPKYAGYDLPEALKFEYYQPWSINDITIEAIPLSHDALNTCGYIITHQQETLVYVTDTGYISQTNLEVMYNADYYIIESNHDSMMLMETNRPIHLKKRILNDEGHLSNYDSAQALAKLVGPKTKEIVLAHISEEANDPQLAYETLIEILISEQIDYKHLKIELAKQYESYHGGNYEKTIISTDCHLSKLECVSDH